MPRPSPRPHATRMSSCSASATRNSRHPQSSRQLLSLRCRLATPITQASPAACRCVSGSPASTVAPAGNRSMPATWWWSVARRTACSSPVCACARPATKCWFPNRFISPTKPPFAPAAPLWYRYQSIRTMAFGSISRRCARRSRRARVRSFSPRLATPPVWRCAAMSCRRLPTWRVNRLP